ncbi:hypothetical protein [Halolamina rubra]|uniref:hypothetical protein n=1 Tax=Halolamina rubra TaxID=1380430 RepID=UPI0006788ED4|nr:hypothetical protein [Halolamina rubra]
MSTNTESDGYRRDNWWGDADIDADSRVNAANRPDPNDPNELIAHRLLRDTASMLCKTTLLEEPWNGGRLAEAIALVFDDDPDFDGRSQVMHYRQEPVELTDPEVRPPTATARDQRHRKRINREAGYISGGHSTGVLIQDRPLDAFMSVVQLWLAGRRTDLLESEKREARQLAARLKQQGELRDVDVLTRVIESVRE